MKGIWPLIASLLFAPSLSWCQKFDNVWVMGYNWDADPTTAETYRLNFDTFPPRLEIAPGDLPIDYAYAGICDSFGKLELYTNNCAIADGEGHIIEQGDSMTTGWELDWCNTYGWHPYGEQNLFIPSSINSKRIFSIYKTTYKSDSGPLEIYQDKVNYATIDLNTGDTLAKVVLKNKTILHNRLGYGELTAVKHGNGRDWWFPVPEETGNKIFVILCSKDSFYVHHIQGLGPNWGNSGAFQACFSPDGTHYARYNRFYGLYLYDFDRCNGELSNLKFFPIISSTQGLLSGVCFSPNNSLLYFADYDSLYQLEVKASDIISTQKLVATFDGFSGGFLGTKFSRITAGPDGRLYIIPPGSTRYMHVINHPNLLGEKCEVQQHIIEFPNPYLNFPNHPNFRLGPLDGSPCDTLGIDNHPLADFRPDPTDTNALALHFWDVSSYAPTQWLWDFSDPASGANNISQDTSPVHLFSAPGFYTVCLTVANAYSASSKCKVVEVKTSEVAAPADKVTFTLYPNPSTGRIIIPNPDGKMRLLQVFDLTGKKVCQLSTTKDEIDLSIVNDGIYFVCMSIEGGKVTEWAKVVIRK